MSTPESEQTPTIIEAVEHVDQNFDAIRLALVRLLVEHLQNQVRWSLLYPGVLAEYQIAENPEEHNEFVKAAGPSVRGSTHAEQLLHTLDELSSYSERPVNLETQFESIVKALKIIALMHDLGETATPPNELDPVGDVPGFLKAEDPTIQERETAIVEAMLNNKQGLAKQDATALFYVYEAIVAKSKPSDIAAVESTIEREMIDYLRSIFDPGEVVDYLSTGLHTIQYLQSEFDNISDYPTHLRNLAILATLSALDKLLTTYQSSPEVTKYLFQHSNELFTAIYFIEQMKQLPETAWDEADLRNEETKKRLETLNLVELKLIVRLERILSTEALLLHPDNKIPLSVETNLTIRHILSKLEKPQHLNIEERLSFYVELLAYKAWVVFPAISSAVPDESVDLSWAATKALEQFRDQFPLPHIAVVRNIAIKIQTSVQKIRDRFSKQTEGFISNS